MVIKVGKKTVIRITTQLLIFFLLTVIAYANNYSSYSSALTPGDNELSLQERIYKDMVITNGYKPIDMPTLTKNSIVQVNITVLPRSNSSVFFYVPEDYATQFTPAVTNFTLTPGQSFTENYTYSSGTENVNFLSYFAICTELDSNATVHWWYDVLYSAKPSWDVGIEVPFSIAAVAFSALLTSCISKRRYNRKDD